MQPAEPLGGQHSDLEIRIARRSEQHRWIGIAISADLAHGRAADLRIGGREIRDQLTR